MAKVKYYAKENSTIGTHSFYAVPIPRAIPPNGIAADSELARLSTNGAQEAKGQKD